MSDSLPVSGDVRQLPRLRSAWPSVASIRRTGVRMRVSLLDSPLVSCVDVDVFVIACVRDRYFFGTRVKAQPVNPPLSNSVSGRCNDPTTVQVAIRIIGRTGSECLATIFGHLLTSDPLIAGVADPEDRIFGEYVEPHFSVSEITALVVLGVQMVNLCEVCPCQRSYLAGVLRVDPRKGCNGHDQNDC